MSRDPEEVWSSEYDSTWEEEEGEEKPRDKREPGDRRQPTNCRKWMTRAARDLQNYRHGYVRDRNYQYYSTQPSQTPNLDFYLDKRHFEPDGLLITQLLEKWKGKYETLERNHSYIQWLFPLREYGMNSCAKPLTNAEMETMKKDAVVQERFLAAYKLMLDFYGIKLENEKTGKMSRADNWESRFKNLNDHSHNNLRITRILKCLGELGFEHFQAPLVKFFLEETLCQGKLQNVKRSALDYFMFTVKNKKERRKLVHFAWENYNQDKQDKFIWGPVEKLRAYQPPAEDEPEAEICGEEKSNEEGKINGQLASCEKNSEVEELKYGSDFQSSENAESPQDSFRPDKKSNEECIPLTKRFDSKHESHEKTPDKGSDAASNNKHLSSDSSSLRTNGVQLLTEEEHKKSDGEEESSVSHEVSPKHDHEVPSAVGHQNESNVESHVTDGTVPKNQENPNTPIGIAKTQTEKRKRKHQNGASNNKVMPNKGPPQSKENVGTPKEGEQRTDKNEDHFNTKLKKLKLSGKPGSERNQKVKDDPPSSVAGKDPQGSSKDPQGSSKDPQASDEDLDINQEGGKRGKMECKEAKEEMPKPHEPLNSENIEKEDDDPPAIEDPE